MGERGRNALLSFFFSFVSKNEIFIPLGDGVFSTFVLFLFRVQCRSAFCVLVERGDGEVGIPLFTTDKIMVDHGERGECRGKGEEVAAPARSVLLAHSGKVAVGSEDGFALCCFALQEILSACHPV